MQTNQYQNWLQINKIKRLATHRYTISNFENESPRFNITDPRRVLYVANGLRVHTSPILTVMGSGWQRRARSAYNRQMNFIHQLGHVFPYGFHEHIHQQNNETPVVLRHGDMDPQRTIRELSDFYAPHLFKHIDDNPILLDYLDENPSKVKELEPRLQSTDIRDENVRNIVMSNIVNQILTNNYKNKVHHPERIKKSLTLDPVVKGFIYPAIDNIYKHRQFRDTPPDIQGYEWRQTKV